MTFCDHCTTTNNTVFDAGTTSKYAKGGGACQKDNFGGSTPGTIANNDYQFCAQGIQIENGGNLVIKDNHFHNILDGGISFTPSATPSGNVNGNVQILHNRFTNCNNGVEINGAINVTIKNNTFVDDLTAGQQRSSNHIRLTPTQRAITNITITNNDLGKSANAGIVNYNNTNPISGIHVTNNSITQSSRYGIDVQAAGPTGGTLDANCFYGNSMGAIRDVRGILPNPGQPSPCPSSVQGASPSPVSITTSSLPGGQVTAPYTTTLVAANGATPYTWTATPLPAGLTLSGAVISGTPTAAATTNVVNTVTDKAGGTASKTLPLVIAAAPPSALTITTSSLPGGQVTAPYTTTLVAANGATPYTWTATPLPAGLTLSGAVISGTPTAAATTNVVSTVTDKAGGTASKTLPLVIAAAAPPSALTISNASLPSGQATLYTRQP